MDTQSTGSQNTAVTHTVRDDFSVIDQKGMGTRDSATPATYSRHDSVPKSPSVLTSDSDHYDRLLEAVSNCNIKQDDRGEDGEDDCSAAMHTPRKSDPKNLVTLHSDTWLLSKPRSDLGPSEDATHKAESPVPFESLPRKTVQHLHGKENGYDGNQQHFMADSTTTEINQEADENRTGVPAFRDLSVSPKSRNLPEAPDLAFADWNSHRNALHSLGVPAVFDKSAYIPERIWDRGNFERKGFVQEGEADEKEHEHEIEEELEEEKDKQTKKGQSHKYFENEEEIRSRCVKQAEEDGADPDCARSSFLENDSYLKKMFHMDAHISFIFSTEEMEHDSTYPDNFDYKPSNYQDGVFEESCRTFKKLIPRPKDNLHLDMFGLPKDLGDGERLTFREIEREPEIPFSCSDSFHQETIELDTSDEDPFF